MVYLYRHKETLEGCITNTKVKVSMFIPTIKKMKLTGEVISRKALFVRIIFWLIAKGKLRIYYVLDTNEKIIHTSYVIPSCFKFSFMTGNDIMIGPCHTDEKYRGQGIYPSVLQYICKERKMHSDTIYILVHENNEPSIRGN